MQPQALAQTPTLSPVPDEFAHLTFEGATHRLRCRHTQGRGVTDYWMACYVLKDMGDGRYKILVFGERYWKDRPRLRRIRYVQKSRVHDKQ